MKKRLSIIISIIVVIGIIIGVTLAFFRRNIFNQDVTFTVEGVNITYNAGNNISGIKLIPVSTLQKGLTDNTAIEKTITVSSNKTAYFNLYMDIETLGNGLKYDYVVWQLKKGNDIVNSGNFANSNAGDTINLLTNEEINSTTSTYTLNIWIDGSVDNSDTVENQDYEFVLRAEAADKRYPEPLDDSGANMPKLVEGLIPVTYYNNNWVKADTEDKNGTYKWYDYDVKQWANAVLVSSTNRATYVSANAGTAIPESDVLAYYVWIPRYKYKVWNINKVTGTDSYNAQTTGIDILFESGTNSTGTVTCTYDLGVTDTVNNRSESCTGSNVDYYTHPAFTFGDDELEGIWVGKFEISSETPDVQTNNSYYGGGTSIALTVRIKPNVRSWRYNRLSNYYKVIYDMQQTNNIYGLSTNRTNIDSHMMKNMEWGAVAYLTNSKYGRCTNNACTEVTINDNSSYYTGGNNYTTNINQTTTGNIYGVYDMSGGSEEYVMGNMSSTAGSYVFSQSSAGSYYTYNGNEKYIDTYSYADRSDDTGYNRSRLGDSFGETYSWYGDKHDFVADGVPWVTRGGYISTGNKAGIFSTWNQNGYYDSVISSRAALIGL